MFEKILAIIPTNKKYVVHNPQMIDMGGVRINFELLNKLKIINYIKG